MDDVRMNELRDGCIWQLDREGRRAGVTFDDAHLAELLAWCAARDLDPRNEKIATYLAGGSLIIHTPVETLVARAARTGQFRGSAVEPQTDKDGVLRLRVTVRRDGWTDPTVLFGSVAGWAGACGGKGQWKTNPENMCGDALLRKALIRTFPEILAAIGGDEDGSDVRDESRPTPAQSAALTRVTRDAAPITADDARQAARGATRHRPTAASPPADDLTDLLPAPDPARRDAAALRAFGLAFADLDPKRQGQITRYLAESAASAVDIAGLDSMLASLRESFGQSHVDAILRESGVSQPYWPRFPRPGDLEAIMLAAERSDRRAA